MYPPYWVSSKEGNLPIAVFLYLCVSYTPNLYKFLTKKTEVEKLFHATYNLLIGPLNRIRSTEK